MNQKEKSIFIYTVPLKTEIFQEDILNKRFGICEKIYNSLNHKVFRIYFELSKTIDWRNDSEQIDKLTGIMFSEESTSQEKKLAQEQRKCLLKNRQQIYFDNNLTKFGFNNLMRKIYKPYCMHIDSCTATQISFDCWNAWEKFLYSPQKSGGGQI